ncbi:hypothetical protein EJK17_00570 [Lactobacillus xujianguonis]|uniref:Uncharacterized protein n=1 Tax=Lactobacillus xujianguonis TaxID=2495899 RepID=A0A437SY05_9LACO|nr:hypothetical protein [Lactobacillus xujianguonis]RVU71801.1 hypothetical protein EJK17_00570 [Lactobacillus xujianguonis]
MKVKVALKNGKEFTFPVELCDSYSDAKELKDSIRLDQSSNHFLYFNNNDKEFTIIDRDQVLFLNIRDD